MDQLKELQAKLDDLHYQILNLLVKRNYMARKVGRYKKEHNLPIMNSQREKDIFRKIMISAENKGLDKKFIQRLFKLILYQSKKVQKNGR